MHDAGKGDKPRPKLVTDDEFAANWERIFRETPQNVHVQTEQEKELDAVKTFVRDVTAHMV